MSNTAELIAALEQVTGALTEIGVRHFVGVGTLPSENDSILQFAAKCTDAIW